MSTAPLNLAEGHLRLVDALLEEQQQLTAVERFAQRHVDASEPLQDPGYEDLIPTGRPGTGEQYAFRVDLDACTGCKACVTACHNLNGLDQDETWRSVGLVIGGEAPGAYQQVITTACHHCEDPACLEGCPALAYEKDEQTGIVRHLDDQCIGCQYCVLKCPYEVPQYNAARGIVRKCDLCTDRLAVGEAPACVQGCPSDAISIRIIAQGDSLADGRLLPIAAEAMPESSVTRPTTRYVGRRALPDDLRPIDLDQLAPAHAHRPLATMLVLSQLSVGVLAIEPFASAWLHVAGIDVLPVMRPILVAVATAIGLLAGATAVLHLGRPARAFRAVLGFRTSWMSREVIALGAFSTAALGYTASSAAHLSLVVNALLWALAVGLGMLMIFCSIMIYVDTRRVFWAWKRTAPKFVGSAFVLAPAAVWAITLMTAGVERASVAASITLPLCIFLMVATVAKLAVDLSVLGALSETGVSALRRSALLLVGPLRGFAVARVTLGTLGGLVVPWAAMTLHGPTDGTLTLWLATGSFILLLGGEWLERHCFFTGDASRAMPGV